MVVSWFLHLAVSGEITVSGRESELRAFIHPGPDIKEGQITLQGVATYKIEPQEYRIEGEVYTRGKDYQGVKDANLKLIESIKEIISDRPGASFHASNTYSITSADLAFSELRELEYRDAFRIKVVDINDVDDIVHRLSTVKGVIVKDVLTMAKDSPEAYWNTLEKAKANINDKVEFYQKSFGVKLVLVGIKPDGIEDNKILKDSPGGVLFDPDIVELEEFYSVSTIRKRPERTDKAQVEKGFFEKVVTVKLSADYEIHFKDPTTQTPQ